MLEAIKKSPIPEIKGVSAEINSIIKGLLCETPEQRLSISDCFTHFKFLKDAVKDIIVEFNNIPSLINPNEAFDTLSFSFILDVFLRVPTQYPDFLNILD